MLGSVWTARCEGRALGRVPVSTAPRECGLWLSLGGFHERGQDWEQTQKIYNCHVLLDSKGETPQLFRLPLAKLCYLNEDSPELFS